MEKEAINPLSYLIGINLDRWPARRGPSAWCLNVRCYWFGVLLYRRWHPFISYGDSPGNWTGVVFCYSRNRAAKDGDLIWSKHKKWGYYAA